MSFTATGFDVSSSGGSLGGLNGLFEIPPESLVKGFFDFGNEQS